MWVYTAKWPETLTEVKTTGQPQKNHPRLERSNTAPSQPDARRVKNWKSARNRNHHRPLRNEHTLHAVLRDAHTLFCCILECVIFLSFAPIIALRVQYVRTLFEACEPVIRQFFRWVFKWWCRIRANNWVVRRWVGKIVKLCVHFG